MPASINPSRRVLGPSFIKTRNAVFYSQGSVVIQERLSTFQVVTARANTEEAREDALTYEIRLTPAGRLNALSVLWPHGASKPGDLVHATAEITAIDLGTNIATFNSLKRFRNGAPVRLATSVNDAPDGLVAGALAYLRKITDTTGTFHDTEADALANLNIKDIADTGTGRHTIIEEEYLIIQPIDGSPSETWWNTAIIGQPALALGGNRTAIGGAVFEAYRRFGVAPTNAASFFTEGTDAIADTSFAFSDIKTETFSMGWGAAEPWATLFTRDGIAAEFPLQLSPWGDTANGVQTRRIDSLGAQVTASPIGLSESHILAKRFAQGAGAGRGRRIVSADPLNLISETAGLLYVRLYGAILTDPGSLVWDQLTERTGELAWAAQRVVTAGVPGDLFYVGADAPA